MLPLALCAVADDEHAEEVLAAGRRLAGTGAFRVAFVHVADGVGDALDRLDVAPDEQPFVVVGDPVEELSRLAIGWDATLVVVGSPHRGPLTGAVLGSVSRRLAREGPRPVLIARPASLPGGGGPIVCGVADGGECSTHAAEAAAALARALDRSLVLVNVVHDAPPLVPMPAVPVVVEQVDPGHAEDAARHMLEDVAERVDAPWVELVVLRGPTAGSLDRLARGRGADMLVVGCRGGGLLRGLFDGAVSLELAHSAERPLVVVPPEYRP